MTLPPAPQAGAGAAAAPGAAEIAVIAPTVPQTPALANPCADADPCADAEIPPLTLRPEAAILPVMSIWTRIAATLAALVKGEGLSVIFDRLRASPAPERSVGFTIAVIALGAKMAKADGEVTRNEVAAFRRIFAIPPGEEANAARVFNLARQDVAGFDAYARKIKAMFSGAGAAEHRQLLIDLMEGLFSIAVADGNYHPGEDEFLAEVARIFGLDGACFAALRARHVEGAPRDPYQILGVDPATALADIRAVWRQAVKDSHPDRMIARGVPPEALKLAERRLIALNEAWDEISQRRAA